MSLDYFESVKKQIIRKPCPRLDCLGFMDTMSQWYDPQERISYTVYGHMVCGYEVTEMEPGPQRVKSFWGKSKRIRSKE